MHEESIQDDLMFDRLVDGELSDGERRRLLESLDTRPEGWRRCALAFLEAQTWRDDLGWLLHEPGGERAVDANVSSSPAIASRRALKLGMASLAIAASLLIAFSLGRMQGDQGPQVANLPSNPAAPMVSAVPPPKSQPPTSTGVDDALILWARDDEGQPRSLRVPLVDAGTLDRQLGVEFRSGLPADVRAQLHDRGYDVQSKRRYAPLWLDNGRPMIVPVEDTKIMPVSQTVY
jgi:hypothetical protein